jgi:ribosomal protein S18 acetylase RimI-like enzyme
VAFSSPELLTSSHDLDDFDCNEPALNDWLSKHALASQGSGAARVFITLTEGERIAGYYALAAAQVGPADATERLMKGQPGARPVPTVLLARLAVDKEFQRQGVGTSLLRDAMLRSLSVAEELGIRAMIVHAKNQAAHDWYENYGFEESPTDPLHMILLMKDLKRVVRSG